MREIKQLGEKPAELRQLRDFLISSILTPMVMAGGKQPSLTPTPIQEAGPAIDLMMARIEPSSRNEQAVLKEQCLRRDNQRCVFTEMVDRKSCEGLPPEKRKDLKICNTQCTHILPFALRKFDPESAFETGVKAQIWWALYRYFPFVAGKIGPASINTPGNAITLCTEAHLDFGAMRIAAEPRGEAHEYRLHNIDANYTMGEFLKKKSTITLTQSDPAVQMPDPDFLRLHYQVSKILEVSGIGWKIARIMAHNELKTPRNVPPDGSLDLGHIISSKMLMDI
ncbi:hypothetical protein V8C35DRAFT_294181 [Trichoderma chlorosporum]